jgi:hypothetical protein
MNGSFVQPVTWFESNIDLWYRNFVLQIGMNRNESIHILWKDKNGRIIYLSTNEYWNSILMLIQLPSRNLLRFVKVPYSPVPTSNASSIQFVEHFEQWMQHFVCITVSLSRETNGIKALDISLPQ